MKSKRFTWPLVTLALSIWVAVAYRIYDSVEGNGIGNPGIKIRQNIKKTIAPDRYVYASDVRDPFRFVLSRRGEDTSGHSMPRKPKVVWSPPPFRLTGILMANKKRTAMLEGQNGAVFFLKEGDTLGGVRVLKIKEQAVTYSYTKKKADWVLER